MLILGIMASQISGHLVTNSYESIQTFTVGSGGTASISFTSIPSTYSHLQLRLLTRTNRADTNDFMTIRFNGDSGSNYAYHSLYGNGASAGANDTGTSTGTPWSGVTAGGNATASMFGAAVVDVLDYSATTKYKTTRLLSGTDQNGINGRIYFMSNLWQNTAAITTVTIIPTHGTLFSEYSSFALYGIRGA